MSPELFASVAQRHRRERSTRRAAWPAVQLAVAGALVLASTALRAQPQGGAFGNASESFVLRALARCLEVNEPQLQVDGARVQLHRCDGRPNQAWRHERGRIVSVANGRCLDVHGPDAGFNGARVQTVSCSGSPHQQWRLEQGRLVARVDDRCLEAEVADPARPLARVLTWDCRDTPAQRWVVTPLPAPPAPPPPVEPRTRDVEAGPLFSNDEARMKCPAVCAPARWSGRWVTTVPGQMSVCGCEVEEVRPPPAPPTRPPHRPRGVPWPASASPNSSGNWSARPSPRTRCARCRWWRTTTASRSIR